MRENCGASFVEVGLLESAPNCRVHAEHGKEIDAGGNRERSLCLAIPSQRCFADRPGERRDFLEAAAVLLPLLEFSIGIEPFAGGAVLSAALPHEHQSIAVAIR